MFPSGLEGVSIQNAAVSGLQAARTASWSAMSTNDTVTPRVGSTSCSRR